MSEEVSLSDRFVRWLYLWAALPCFLLRISFGTPPKTIFDILILAFCCVGFLGFIQSIKKLRLSSLEKKVLLFCWLFLSFFIIRAILLLNGVFETRSDYFQLAPVLMELKPFVYIMAGIMAVSVFGSIRTSTIQKIADFASWMMISSFVFFTVIKLAFGRTSLIVPGDIRTFFYDEPNYDAMIILIGVLLHYEYSRKILTKRFILYTVALLISFSKTGVVCFAALTFIYFFDFKNMKRMLILAFGSVALAAIIWTIFKVRFDSSRVDSLQDIDRVRFLMSFFDFYKDAQIHEKFFGFFPGFALRDSDASLNWMIEKKAKDMGILGLHAFHFHIFYVRAVLTWGLPLVLFSGLYFVSQLKRNRYSLAAASLVLLPSMTLSLFYLSTVSFFFVTSFLSLHRNRGRSQLKAIPDRKRNLISFSHDPSPVLKLPANCP